MNKVKCNFKKNEMHIFHIEWAEEKYCMFSEILMQHTTARTFRDF